MSQFRFHPIVEGLRCNEDGTEILLNNIELRIKEETNGIKYIHIGAKRVTVIRIILECWLGMPENNDMAARRHEENAGDHYSNLYWGKQGMTLKNAKVREYNYKISKEEFEELQKRKAKRELRKALKEKGHSINAYNNAVKRYGKENKK